MGHRLEWLWQAWKSEFELCKYMLSYNSPPKEYLVGKHSVACCTKWAALIMWQVGSNHMLLASWYFTLKLLAKKHLNWSKQHCKWFRCNFYRLLVCYYFTNSCKWILQICVCNLVTEKNLLKLMIRHSRFNKFLA